MYSSRSTVLRSQSINDDVLSNSSDVSVHEEADIGLGSTCTVLPVLCCPARVPDYSSGPRHKLRGLAGNWVSMQIVYCEY